MTVNDASLGESGSKLSKVAATSLLMGVTRASSEAYAGGEPEEFRKDCGADDRSLLGFYHGDGKLRAEGEQVLSEKALFPQIIIDITIISFNRVVFFKKMHYICTNET